MMVIVTCLVDVGRDRLRRDKSFNDVGRDGLMVNVNLVSVGRDGRRRHRWTRIPEG